MNKDERINKIQKFVLDPDWVLIEQMLLEYMEPLEKITSIDTKRTNDEIATDVKARQIVSEQLGKFLRDSRILGKIAINNNNSFK